jgi:nicotinate (nicotinamide) nucleotide adenylyltransferase
VTERILSWVRPPQLVIPGMRVGLLGGSFNPPHRGHVYASELALRRLRLDFVWWLVSPQNPLKPAKGMASFSARIDAAKRFVRNRRILVSDLEAQLGTRFTVDSLTVLRRRFPKLHFVWLMGTDNLVQLPRWRDWQKIFTVVPMAVVARPGSTASARSSVAARRFAYAYIRESPRFAELTPPAWTILEGRRDPVSGTAIRCAANSTLLPDENMALMEQRLSTVTLGEVTQLNGNIVLAPYDPEWRSQFTKLAELIRAALGSAGVLIEHAGSTSVPGLSAKPIIDIILAVPNSADEAAYIPRLERTGFVLRIREPGWFEHRMLKSPLFEGNIHVFSHDCEEIGRMLSFRDHLRRNEDDRRLYERTKLSLTARSWKYVQEYADAKSEVIQTIMVRTQRCASPSVVPGSESFRDGLKRQDQF